MKNKGFFVAFEGGEGCGKSTQIITAYTYLMQVGIGAVITKQPGGTALGNVIRSLLLDANVMMSRETETLLYLADRAHHVDKVIQPALDRGEIVLCDRYHLSTMAYQCAARGVSKELVTRVFSEFCHGLTPDLTIWIDTDVETALSRAKERGGDRMERESLEFHQKVYNFFAEIDQHDSYVRVDGNQNLQKVSDDVTEIIKKIFTMWTTPIDRRSCRRKL